MDGAGTPVSGLPVSGALCSAGQTPSKQRARPPGTKDRHPGSTPGRRIMTIEIDKEDARDFYVDNDGSRQAIDAPEGLSIRFGKGGMDSNDVRIHFEDGEDAARIAWEILKRLGYPTEQKQYATP